jgi:hypothetical protein
MMTYLNSFGPCEWKEAALLVIVACAYVELVRKEWE